MSKLKIGARLRELREAKGVSQYDVERETGISQKNISCYENNYNVPPLEILLKLSNYYRVSLDYIVLGEDRESIKKESVKYIELIDYVYKANNFDRDEIELLKGVLSRFVYANKNRNNFEIFEKNS